MLGTRGCSKQQNSMCKCPVVGGSTEHKRIWQNSVAGVPRGRVVRRKEVETGGGPAMHQLGK